MRPWLVVQHVAHEGPGLIAVEAAARGITLDVRLMDRGDPLPDLEPGRTSPIESGLGHHPRRRSSAVPGVQGSGSGAAYADSDGVAAAASRGTQRDFPSSRGDDLSAFGGVVVMGGPMGVYEATSYPHIAAEVALLHAAAGRGLPVLAVCLGSQLLAAAMGARVFKGPAPEIGFGSVQLTDEGCRDPVLGPDGPVLPAFHWHGDTFDLPAGATHLGASEAYRSQAFRIDARVYGIQFHIEPDAALLESWLPHLPSGFVIDESRRRRTETAGRRIIGRFFDVALGSRG